MALPETEELLLPLLKVIEDKDEYKVREILDDVIDLIDITEEDKNIKAFNGEPIISARICTANTYLKKAELVKIKRAGYFFITENGLKILAEDPDEITEEDLMKNPKFRAYKDILTPVKEEDKTNQIHTKEPRTMMEAAYLQQLEEIQKEMEIEAKKGNSTKFFIPKDQKENYENKTRKQNEEKAANEKDFPTYIIYSQFSPADELLKFVELYERGYLTKEEFNRKKEELLEY